MVKESDLTVDQLRKIFVKNGLEFKIQEQSTDMVKVNFIVNNKIVDDT
jgi:hypothetical protein